MSFLTRWFRKSEPDDFENVLDALANNIQKRQSKLADIRTRQRHTAFLFTLYASALWIAYVAVWFAARSLIPNPTAGSVESSFDRLVKAIPVLLGPFLVLFLRRIVQLAYQRSGNSEERTLQKLRKEQRDKIEEFKKKTNYYKTRDLLSRFDDAPSTTPAKPRSAQATPQSKQSTSQPIPPQLLAPPATPQANARGPPGGPAFLSPSPAAQRLLPARRQWYDKIADAILGDEEGGAGATSASRYALICQKCFAHNGLVKESMWEDAQYVCPKCNHFNPSARSLRTGSPSPSPITPANGNRRLPLGAASPSSPSPTGSNAGGQFAPPLLPSANVPSPPPAPDAEDAPRVDDASGDMDIDVDR